MKSSIVLGLNYGDEGKGSMVNFLCKKYVKDEPLVVRFSSGHQVGHTVVEGKKKHVFSNFGSGTLSKTPTYWSEFCTFNPSAIRSEVQDLITDKRSYPILYINDNAMVTTPYDILSNRISEDKNGHGSVGVGFGTTIQRNEDHFKLYARDLKFPTIRDFKLKQMEIYYANAIKIANKGYDVNHLIQNFKKDCDYLLSYFDFVPDLESVIDGKCYRHLIFEGNQGIMLDQDYGFFPNVTRCSTTSKNAIGIIEQLVDFTTYETTIYYMTRAYQTRHGNGFMTNEELDNTYIIENPLETNVLGKYQGAFRKTPLDIESMNYALSCDRFHRKNASTILGITCVDQIMGKIPFTIRDNGSINMADATEIGSILGFNNEKLLLSNSDKGNFVRELYPELQSI